MAIEKMKPEQKDEFQIMFTKTLMEVGNIADPIAQGVALFRILSDIIDSIYNAGRVDGFAEGHREARRQLERKFGKLN